MEDRRSAAREALAAARNAHQEAARALHGARLAAMSNAGVPTMTAALDRARESLDAARTSVREATEALESALRVLTAEQARFERAETELRIAHAIAGEPAALRLVSESFARTEADLRDSLLALETAEQRLYKHPPAE